MSKRLYISLIFSNLVVTKTLSSNHRMYNLYTKFVKILEICKQFSENLVNESGNVPRRGPVPKFSDLEVVALSLTAETESIDSEKWLFDYKLQEYKDNIPNLISRRQFNDRRKKTSGLCEEHASGLPWIWMAERKINSANRFIIVFLKQSVIVSF